MNWIVTVYTAILFFVLTPNIVLRLPPKGKPIMVAAVHAVIFALIYHFTHMMVWKMSTNMGGFSRDGFSEGVNGNDKKHDNKKPDNKKHDNKKHDNKKPDDKKHDDKKH